MICPHCGAENRDDGRFCKQCGQPLATMSSSGDERRCPQCGTSLRAAARFCKQCGEAVPSVPKAQRNPANRCPRCGMLLRPEARFCPKCGVTLSKLSRPSGPVCPQCGTPLRPGARFCKQCGATLTTSARPVADPINHPAPPPPVPPSDKRYYSSSGHLLPQQTVTGRYLIVEQIAEGGMGAIYKAKDLHLESKIVALKEMSEEKIPPLERPKVLEAFEREAELLANMQHPNLTRVTDRFKEQGRHYMVMEFINGDTLDELLETRSQPFPEEQVLAWAEQLCEVLSFLHNQKPQPIIYRDIKPGNIMIVRESDQVKLIDFGIARIYKPHKKKDTIPFGTEGYAPPEQYGKAQTDERADIYALGATLHQLLTLEEPRTHLMNLPPVRKLNRNVSRRVAEAIDKAVDMDKRKRHQSMAEMWEALSGEPPRWPHLTPPPKAQEEKEDVIKTRPGSNIPIARPTPAGALQVRPVYGEITTGQRGVQLVHTLHFEPGQTVKLKSDADWVKLSSDKVGPRGGKVTLIIETAQLEPAHLELQGNLLTRWIGWHTRELVPIKGTHRTEVVLRAADGKEDRLPVTVEVKPTLGQQAAGWVGTMIAMLMELGTAGAIAATLLSAMGLL
ncbi:MAG: protein kinase domain-containing protein [Anaerolineae bacterium]